MTTKTTTVWKQAHQFEATHEGNTIKIDGSNENGHGPKALLLSGLAGCSGIDVVDILTKMRVEFSDFSMNTEATVAEDHPKVYTGITITYKMKTSEENRDKVIKAIELSLGKYCGVAAMLAKNSPIDYKLELH